MKRIIVSPNSVRTSAYECPACYASLSAATCAGPEARKPAPGDLTVCFYCATVLVYTENDLRLVTEDDLEGLTAENRTRLDDVAALVKKSLQ